MRLIDGRLDWAVIPAAGRGTRLRTVRDDIPKVLLPVGARTMLDWALEEAVCSQVAAIAVIVGAAQPTVREYVDSVVRPDPAYDGVELHVVVQPAAAGIGDALLRCRALTGDSPFGVVIPDNWFDGDTPVLARLGESRAETGMCTIGLIEVSATLAPLLGNVGGVDLEPLGEEVFRITRLADKAPGVFTVSGDHPRMRGCARYALNAGFYDALEATGPPEEGEWDDVPAFQHLIERGELAGRRIEANLFDVGHEAGYRAASEVLAERTDRPGSDGGRSDGRRGGGRRG